MFNEESDGMRRGEAYVPLNSHGYIGKITTAQFSSNKDDLQLSPKLMYRLILHVRN